MVDVKIKMSPKEAGALYMKYQALRAKNTELRRAVVAVCKGELFDEHDGDGDYTSSDYIADFIKYAEGFSQT